MHPGQVNDADRIGDVIGHPDLRGRPETDSDRIHPDRYIRDRNRHAGGHIEQLEAVVRKVANRERVAVRAQLDGMDWRRFPVEKVGCCELAPGAGGGKEARTRNDQR